MCAHFVIASVGRFNQIKGSDQYVYQHIGRSQKHPDYSPNTNNHIIIALEILYKTIGSQAQ